ncbi:MAG TPA: VWA domain-containing protein, partial [Methylophilaceae bacterium]|nr:VWA domain-containing protein [Methylophilaceae bacterium]
STLDESYLRDLAKEIGARYTKGLDQPDFYRFIHAQPPAATFVTAYSVRWLYLLLAALLIVATFRRDILARWIRRPAKVVVPPVRRRSEARSS